MFLVILIHARSLIQPEHFRRCCDEKGENMAIINLYGFLGTELINSISIALSP